VAGGDAEPDCDGGIPQALAVEPTYLIVHCWGLRGCGLSRVW
jgi:hypothetical protein